MELKTQKEKKIKRKKVIGLSNTRPSGLYEISEPQRTGVCPSRQFQGQAKKVLKGGLSRGGVGNRARLHAAT
jgi:hypothetical protein